MGMLMTMMMVMEYLTIWKWIQMEMVYLMNLTLWTVMAMEFLILKIWTMTMMEFLMSEISTTVMESKTVKKLILMEMELPMIKVFCNESSRGSLRYLKMIMMTDTSESVICSRCPQFCNKEIPLKNLRTQWVLCHFQGMNICGTSIIPMWRYCVSSGTVANTIFSQHQSFSGLQ